MTFVGKILVVVQVVLSICFMAFAGAVYSFQEDWQTAYEQKVDELANRDAELAAARQSIDLLKSDIAAGEVVETDVANYLNRFAELTQHIDDEGVKRQLNELANQSQRFESQVQTLTQALEAERNQHEQTKSEINRLQILSDVNQREAKERAAEAQEYKEVNTELVAQLNQAVGDLQNLRDQVFGKDTQIDQMVAKQETLLDELALYVKASRDSGLNVQEYAALNESPPPIVRGKVLNTRKTDGGVELVEMSLGSDDGLVKGHVLDVFDTNGRGKYLGQVRIVYTTPDRSVGTVVETVRNGRIEEGNNVTTKL